MTQIYNVIRVTVTIVTMDTGNLATNKPSLSQCITTITRTSNQLLKNSGTIYEGNKLHYGNSNYSLSSD